MTISKIAFYVGANLHLCQPRETLLKLFAKISILANPRGLFAIVLFYSVHSLNLRS